MKHNRNPTLTLSEAFAIAVGITGLVVSLIANCNSNKSAQLANEANSISKGANAIAKESQIIAEKAREDIRAIERLDIEPSFALDLQPYGRSNNYFLHVNNNSGVDAVQGYIQLNRLTYDSVRNKIRIYSSGSESTYTFDKIKPMSTVEIKLPLSFLSEFSIDPPFFNVLEVCILYRREPDRKTYGFRSFYFVGPNGGFVPENSELNSSRYGRIIEAAYQSTPCNNIILKTFPVKKYRLSQPRLDSIFGRY